MSETLTESGGLPTHPVSKLRRGAYGTARGWIRTAALILFIGGLQAWEFDRQITDLSEAALSNLGVMQRERSDNRVVNAALAALQQYWRTVGSELERDQVLELRDTFVERYNADRRSAVREFSRVVATLEPSSRVGESALQQLRARVFALEDIYAEKTGEAVTRYRNPPWYLQPTASLLNGAADRLRSLRFNHALSLMAAGDTGAARPLLEELRQQTADDPRWTADVLFAQARMHYDAFTQEPDPGYLREARELARQSVRRNTENAIPKLFLEYLLSVDLTSGNAEVEPVEGQGSGEGQGGRGVISQDDRDF